MRAFTSHLQKNSFFLSYRLIKPLRLRLDLLSVYVNENKPSQCKYFCFGEAAVPWVYLFHPNPNSGKHCCMFYIHFAFNAFYF